MNILKPIIGFILLLLGGIFLLGDVGNLYQMHIVGKAYERQDPPETFGNFIGFSLIAAGAIWMMRKGWQWLTFRQPPESSPGRSDILDDGDLLQKK